MIPGEVGDQLADPGAQLVREVRRRRPDQRVDVLASRLGHRGQPNYAQDQNPLARILIARKSRGPEGGRFAAAVWLRPSRALLWADWRELFTLTGSEPVKTLGL